MPPGVVLKVRNLLSNSGHQVAREDFRPLDEKPRPNRQALPTVPTEHPLSCGTWSARCELSSRPTARWTARLVARMGGLSRRRAACWR